MSHDKRTFYPGQPVMMHGASYLHQYVAIEHRGGRVSTHSLPNAFQWATTSVTCRFQPKRNNHLFKENQSIELGIDPHNPSPESQNGRPRSYTSSAHQCFIAPAHIFTQKLLFLASAAILIYQGQVLVWVLVAMYLAW